MKSLHGLDVITRCQRNISRHSIGLSNAVPVSFGVLVIGLVVGGVLLLKG